MPYPTSTARTQGPGARGALALTITAVTLALSLPAPAALADPPPWAPAHGYRDKKDKKDKHGRDDHRRGERRGDHDDDRHGRPIVVVPAPVYGGLPALPNVLAGGRCDRGLVGANLGTLLGAAAGGFLGSKIGDGDGQLAATAAGTLLGAAFGNSLLPGFDAPDRGCLVQTLEQAGTGQTIVWDNPDAGARYEVVPTRDFAPEAGRYCREYLSRAIVGGRRQEVFGTACRTPDGSWQIVD